MYSESIANIRDYWLSRS